MARDLSAIEGQGRIQEYVGGYTDWLRQRERPAAEHVPAAPQARSALESSVGPATRRLSYNERRELDALPARLESLEAELSALQALANGAEFYREPADRIAEVLGRIETLEAEIPTVYARWDELDSRA